MNVTVLGAAGEVGRSGILVEQDSTRLLMDYGVMFERRDQPPKYPLPVRSRDLAGVIITHAHLDHSGNVPALYETGNVDAYATAPTFDLSRLLIEDMLKIKKSKQYSFDFAQLHNMMRNAKDTEYGQTIRKGPLSFQLRESGHVIGGATVLAEGGGKRIFYTGDIKTTGSRLLKEADLDIGEIDLLITESTYSQSEQIPRQESERDLVEFANEILDNRGTLFIPSFSVERAQEMVCILKAAGFKHKIVMDGMALKVNDIVLQYPQFHRDPSIFREAVDSAVSIRRHEDRKKALKEPCVVISPAGMLVGGNAVFYLQELAFDKKNGIALVSYQGEDTPGRRLLDEGTVSYRGENHSVSATVRQFQFSGHSDRRDLFEMVRNVRGNPRVLTVHGDRDSCEMFAQQINEEFGLEASAASVGETIAV